MELEETGPGKQGLLKQETQYPDSDGEAEDKYFDKNSGSPNRSPNTASPNRSPNRSFEEDPEEERDKVVGATSPPNMSSSGLPTASLHFITIYDKVRTTYFCLSLSEKYTEAKLDLKNLKKSMVEMKIEKREVYRTTNSPDADWTSIFVKGGLYVSALFDKRVPIGERMKLLLQVKKVIQESTKTINLATNSRVVKKSSEAITSCCKTFTETLAATGIDSKLDKQRYSKCFEDLLGEVEITDISEQGYEQEFPVLKDFIDDNYNRFKRLEAWRSGKSKLIVAVFAVVMLLGIVAKFLSMLLRK